MYDTHKKQACQKGKWQRGQKQKREKQIARGEGVPMGGGGVFPVLCVGQGAPGEWTAKTRQTTSSSSSLFSSHFHSLSLFSVVLIIHLQKYIYYQHLRQTFQLTLNHQFVYKPSLAGSWRC